MPAPARAKVHRFTQVRKRSEARRDEKLRKRDVYLGLKVHLGDAFFKDGSLSNAELARRLDDEAKFWRRRNSPGVPFMADLFEFLRDWQRLRMEVGAKASRRASPKFSLGSGPCGSCGPDRLRWTDGQTGATGCSECLAPATPPTDRSGDSRSDGRSRTSAGQGRPTRTKLPQ